MSEWIEWKGGECPVKPGTLIMVKFRLVSDEKENYASLVSDPGTLSWDHKNIAADIIAYRIEEQS